MKRIVKFVSAFAVTSFLISQHAFANNEAEIYSSGSPALEHALTDMHERGLRPRDFSKEVEHTNFNMWDNQHEAHRIKHVSGVLAGDVLFLTDSANKVVNDLEGASEVHLVLSQVD